MTTPYSQPRYIYRHHRSIDYVWHDQGKWVTCRKLQLLFSYTTFSKFFITIHYNWMSGKSYDTFINAKNNIKQRNLNTTFFANISKTISPTSDSFPLIMSHISKTISPSSDSFPLIMSHMWRITIIQRYLMSARLILGYWAKYLVKL